MFSRPTKNCPENLDSESFFVLSHEGNVSYIDLSLDLTIVQNLNVLGVFVRHKNAFDKLMLLQGKLVLLQLLWYSIKVENQRGTAASTVRLSQSLSSVTESSNKDSRPLRTSFILKDIGQGDLCTDTVGFFSRC